MGYRVQSQIAMRFRRWDTERLHEYIQKEFALDDDRLKQGGHVILENFYREFVIFVHLKEIFISRLRIFMRLLFPYE